LYDKINTKSTPQIRNPPSDAVQRAKRVVIGATASEMNPMLFRISELFEKKPSGLVISSCKIL
ncbi:hypothetical protein AMECASPLE_012924, partial [Ameca splendens]